MLEAGSYAAIGGIAKTESKTGQRLGHIATMARTLTLAAIGALARQGGGLAVARILCTFNSPTRSVDWPSARALTYVEGKGWEIAEDGMEIAL